MGRPAPYGYGQLKADWIVIGGQYDHATCTRCGEKLLLDLPCVIHLWVAAGKAFIRIHKRCRPR